MAEQQEAVWPAPTQEQLDRAESLVLHPRRLLYFLERLDNPLWLAPLAARGWFDAERIPEPAVDDAGIAQISDWPPAAYLARVAGSVPETAEGIIETIGGTTNPLVQRHLVTALLALPPQRAATFVGAVVSWIRGPYAAWLDERALTSLTTAFLQLADTDAGEVLALALLNAVHDEYVLGELAQALSEPLAESGPTSVGIFADALNQRADANHHLDLVNFGRVSIGAHRGNQHLDGDTDPLIDGLRDAALNCTRRTGQPDVMNELLSRPDAIYRRIAYHVATVVINEFGGDAPQADQGPADSFVALRARGRDCVMSAAALADSSTLLEYGQLVHAMLPYLSAADLETLAEWVRAGPELSDDEVQRLSAFEGGSSDDVVGAFADRWRAERLTLFGPDNLPPPLRQIADELTARGIERPQHPGLSHVTSSWPRSQSPLSADEVASMPVAHLVTWLADHPPSQRSWFDSPESSLADQLAEDVRSRPAEYTAYASPFATLAPLYVSKLLAGLESAIHTSGANRPDDEPPSLGLVWSNLLDASAIIADLPDTGEPDARHAPDSPRWLHRSLARLIDTSLTVTASGLTLDHADGILAILTQLLDSPDPTRADEADDAATSDPTFRSINSVRGVAMNAIMAFIGWWHRQGGTETSLPAQVTTLLDRNLDVSLDPSPAIRSVYGQHILQLHHQMPTWTRAHINEIFGPTEAAATLPTDHQQPTQDAALTLDRRLGQVAFDTYLLSDDPYSSTWDLLQPHYESALHALSKPPRGRRGSARDTRQRLLDHILLFVVWDVLNVEDPRLKPVFRSQWAGDAFMQLGFALQHSTSVDEGTADGLRRIWTWWRKRAERRTGDSAGAARMVAGFHRWWHASKLGADWEFDELLAVLKLSPRIETPATIIQDMVKKFGGREKEALEAIETILGHAGSDQQRYYAAGKAEQILRALSRNEGAEIRRLTQRFLQTLAAWGMIELAQKIVAESE
ncbi:hypothetical protein [Amycolatopsis sp. H20-H5]|uniref:hypothetical protein n=1 Tax=Amycolatopsis sp. H20-H5 TaxID=3046309 RepID=UPI002DC031BF|nr:hypothetical protein [Amycolatopsis sp. H20-H5]MEC3974243.1 hypothetical protein [Amycolatopsis sp. H20-H5]